MLVFLLNSNTYKKKLLHPLGECAKHYIARIWIARIWHCLNVTKNLAVGPTMTRFLLTPSQHQLRTLQRFQLRNLSLTK